MELHCTRCLPVVRHFRRRAQSHVRVGAARSQSGSTAAGQHWLHTAAVAAERRDFTRNRVNMRARTSRGDPASYRAAKKEGRA
ncbi:MAG: hypothetical protein QOG95_4052, partial [Mycobacterium sp.]|nr:hypothetical protein [Mycobacterium sp.]